MVATCTVRWDNRTATVHFCDTRNRRRSNIKLSVIDSPRQLLAMPCAERQGFVRVYYSALEIGLTRRNCALKGYFPALRRSWMSNRRH